MKTNQKSPVWPFPPRLLEYPSAPPVPRRSQSPVVPRRPAPDAPEAPF